MKAHVAFLNKHYASGRFVVSGRKVPREGGIIIVVEFRAGQRAPDLPERIG